MSVHAKMKTHISKTAQRLEDEVESRPWHGWPGIIAWRWVGRANKLDINFFGHKLGASANMIYWCDAASLFARPTRDVPPAAARLPPHAVAATHRHSIRDLSESAERPRALADVRRSPLDAIDAAPARRNRRHRRARLLTGHSHAGS